MAEEMDLAADSGQVNGFAVEDERIAPANPYETNPDLIPKDDPYLARSVHYGRYGPRDDDFKPDYDCWYQSDPEVTAYWEGIVRKSCIEENSLGDPGSREAFAVGSVIIRVDRDSAEGAAERYSRVNANELSSARKAEDALKETGVAVPAILFCGTIEGKNVTVESRIPGVSLEVAWRYLTGKTINILKQQCRDIIQRLGAVDPASPGPSYVCSGLNSQPQHDIQKQEAEILFEERGEHENLCLVHNNMVRSNIIVRDDRVIGILGWRQSGFFGYERARRVHQGFRMPEQTFIGSGGGDINEPSWSDIYDNLSEAITNGPIAENGGGSTPIIKDEPSTMALETFPVNGEMDDKLSVPQLDGSMESRPTSKQVNNLKRGSRASSVSERSSPAASAKTTPTGKKPRASKKGAAAKKTTSKKRKTKDQDGEANGQRSNTPSSRTSKTPGPKKQGSASVAGSPAPEHKSDVEVDSDESYEDANEVFCICRRPDNHTWMIGCDGGCEDWFHGKCVKIDSRDAELIERYICPNCADQGKGRTTWKPMCRLPICRKPARLTGGKPSKYCSDDHGREFMRQHLDFPSGLASRKASPVKRTPARGDEGKHQERNGFGSLASRGGVLTIGELKAAVVGVSSAEEFRRLGDRIVSPPPEAEDPDTETKTQNNNKLGLDVQPKNLTYSPDEAAKLDKLRKRREDLSCRKEMLETRNNFVGLVRQRSKSILEHLKQTDPKGGWKDICGFDTRLAWSDEEFDEWRFSEAGEKALKDGSPEALATSFPEEADGDGDTAMNGGDGDENDLNRIARGVCTKKRCERHKQWVKVQQQDILFEENTVNQDLTKCEKEAHAVVERAVLRMWAEGDSAQVNGV